MPEKTKQHIDWAGKLGALWCVLMHDSPAWPIHGEYQCRRCGRHYPVPWAGKNQAGTAVAPYVVLLPIGNPQYQVLETAGDRNSNG
jgi:hypothetical protein